MPVPTAISADAVAAHARDAGLRRALLSPPLSAPLSATDQHGQGITRRSACPRAAAGAGVPAHLSRLRAIGRRAPYWRAATVSGMESSMPASDTLGHLRRRRHPCAADAIPKRGAFPIVVFSPGLYGSSEMYSQLCASISSFGYVVAALEHEDGSACYADAGDGAIPYKRPPDGFAYGRESVVGFRRPFLDQRLRETESAILALLDKNADGALGEVLAATQERSSVVLTGHSFGGASAVRVSQELGRTRPGAISKLALLDTWAFSLDDATVNSGTSLPTRPSSATRGRQIWSCRSSARCARAAARRGSRTSRRRRSTRVSPTRRRGRLPSSAAAWARAAPTSASCTARASRRRRRWTSSSAARRSPRARCSPSTSPAARTRCELR